MRKIKDKLVKEIYKTELSRLEILCLLNLIDKSNERGIAKGIYYKDISKEIDCSVAQYYNLLSSLKEMRFIDFNKSDDFRADNDITILGNNFAEDGYNNYIDINIDLFKNEKFKRLRAGAMRTVLYLVFRIKKQKYDDTSVYFNEKNRLLYNKYTVISKQIGITVRMLKSYVNELISNKIISLGRKIDVRTKKYDIITLSKKILAKVTHIITQKGSKTKVTEHEMHSHYKHFIKTLCRRKKIKADEINIDDTAMLMKQYKSAGEKNNKDIYNVIKNAFNLIENNILDSKFIHYVVKSLIKLDYASNVVLYKP